MSLDYPHYPGVSTYRWTPYPCDLEAEGGKEKGKEIGRDGGAIVERKRGRKDTIK